MNYTNNYHLPQWEKSDRVLMDDFNQAMSDIESGLDRVEQNASSSASSLAGSAAQAAAQAQRTANSALSAANSAQASADKAYRPGYLPYVTGTYIGNGSTISIDLGFKPSFLILTGQFVGGKFDTGINNVGVVGMAGNMSSMVQLTSSGFSVKDMYDTNTPVLNSESLPYSYIAFR